jgi:hypothetical protein
VHGNHCAIDSDPRTMIHLFQGVRILQAVRCSKVITGKVVEGSNLKIEHNNDNNNVFKVLGASSMQTTISAQISLKNKTGTRLTQASPPKNKASSILRLSSTGTSYEAKRIEKKAVKQVLLVKSG